jgi:hypothetical protein
MKTTNAMKNLLLKGALGVALLGGFTSSAMASLLGSTGTGENAKGPFNVNNVGEYTFRIASGPITNDGYAPVTADQGALGTPSFQTFCLEQAESVGGIGVLVSYVVNDEALDGGGNNLVTHGPAGDQGGDRVSIGTAWLYSQFAQGVLANYFTAADRNIVAALLQRAIWALEDEIPDPVGNMFFDAAATAAGSADLAQDNATTGLYGVYVLNNTKISNQTKAQDMLWYRAPDGGSTVMLLGLSLTGLSLVARSKRLARTA